MPVEKRKLRDEKLATFFPRSVLASPGERIKKGEGTIPSVGPYPSVSPDVMRGPTRRFYAPDLMLSTMFIPVDRRTKNKWRRWFYERDVVVGPVIDIFADLPWSSGEINCPDPYVKKVFEQTIEETRFFSMLPFIEREYLITGEIILHFYFDEQKGYWTHIIVHDPDYIEIEEYPFVYQEKKIYIVPDEAIRIIAMSNEYYYAQARQRIPRHVLKNILWGKNLLLSNDRTAHMVRKTRPNAVRGTSIIDRLFRYLMYEDKLIEAQISIADNYIYPLKIFKLGNDTMGIPPKSHADALAELLLHAQFDPNFAIIYHYGLSYEQHGYEGKLLRMEHEFDRINKMKMLALGVSDEFLRGQVTFASANVYMQLLLSRAATARARHEKDWIYPKFFKTLSQIRGFYRRTQAELSHGIRVKRSAAEKEEALIVPTINWHKSLTGREDREYLEFLRGLWEKTTVSSSTLVARAGLDFKKELENIKNDERLKLQVGVETKGPVAFFKTLRRKVAELFGKKGAIIEYPEKWDAGEPFKDEGFSKRRLRQLNAAMWKKLVEKVKSDVLREALEEIDLLLDSPKQEKESHIKKLYRLGRVVPYTLLELKFDGKDQPYDELIFEDFLGNPFEDELNFRRACLDAFSVGQLMSLQELGIEGTRLFYVNEDGLNHLRRFKVSSLLSKDLGLGDMLYPDYEVLYFLPEIESFGSPNCVLVERRKTFVTKKGKKIENLPIEYKSFFEDFDFNVRFVEDFMRDKDWLKEKVAFYRKTKLEDNIIMGMIQKDAVSENVFKGKNLFYVSLDVFKKNGHPKNLVLLELKK